VTAFGEGKLRGCAAGILRQGAGQGLDAGVERVVVAGGHADRDARQGGGVRYRVVSTSSTDIPGADMERSLLQRTTEA
jgi:hypothetical protein